MSSFPEPRSPRRFLSPPESPAKSPMSPGKRKTQKRNLGEMSPGGLKQPRPKRVNSYSELNFSSIVRVDSLGTMALPAFAVGEGSTEDKVEKRSTRAPSFGIDVDEADGQFLLEEDEVRADVTAGATPPAIVAAFGRARPMPAPRPVLPPAKRVTVAPAPTPPPARRPSMRRNAHSFAEIGEEEVEPAPAAPAPAPSPSVPIRSVDQSPPIAIAPRDPRSPPSRPVPIGAAASAPRGFPTGQRGFGESLDLGGFSPGAPTSERR